MKILLGYSHYPYDFDIGNWVEDWLNRLRPHGIEIEKFCLTLDAPGPRLTWPELDARWKAGDEALFTMYENLAKRLETCDVLVNWNGINLHPEFIKMLPNFTVYGCFDDPESSADLSKPVAAAYDLAMVGNIAELDTYRSWGVKEVRFWPNGFRSNDYDPRLTKAEILDQSRDFDLTLLCERTSPWRQARLDKFVSAFPAGNYFGPGWPAGFLPEAARVPLLQRTRVGVNLHNSTGPINFRTFYLPANGVMQVCDNRSHLGRIFELGKEVVGFESMEEAIDLCHYYLSHEDERRSIAAAGFDRVHRDYNEVAVMKLLIGYVNELIEKKVKKPEPTSSEIFSGSPPPRNSSVAIPSKQLMPGKIFLHQDLSYSPDQWCKRFQAIFDHNGVPYRLVNLLSDDYLEVLAEVGPEDSLIGRFGHRPDDLAKIRLIYNQLIKVFKGRVFPEPLSYYLYDNKFKQVAFFQQHGHPTPVSAVINDQHQLEKFVEVNRLSFPLVIKNSGGAGSSGVSLASNPADVKNYPVVAQEFCRGNDGDCRINIIGNRAMGYLRANRDDDFRASGSGKLIYPVDLHSEPVGIAYQISKQHGFRSMAYDFVKRNGSWVLLEISYAYVDTYVRDCAYYYDMQNGGRKCDKQGVYPQDFIWVDFAAERLGTG